MSSRDARRSARGLRPVEQIEDDGRWTRDKRYRTVGPMRKLINNWFDRLMGAVSDGSLSDQDEEYDSGRTSRDFIWNSVGQGAWGMVFPLLTIVVTQLTLDVERAGMFSFAFVLANLLYILANYGVRTYQVSDLDEYHSFADYQVNRIATCVIMLIVGFIITGIAGFTGEMATICLGVFAYKAVDALGEIDGFRGLYEVNAGSGFPFVIMVIHAQACHILFRPGDRRQNFIILQCLFSGCFLISTKG